MSKHILIILCILVAAPASDGDDERFRTCSRPYSCGRLQAIRYPFWGNNIRPQYCGRQGFELKCDKTQNHSTIQIRNQKFQVLDINVTHQIMKIARADYLGSDCTVLFRETSINSNNLFSYSDNARNLSLFFNCSAEFPSQVGQNNFSCSSTDRGVINSVYTIDDDDKSRLQKLYNSCSGVIKVPIQLTSDNFHYLSEGKLLEALKQGFQVRYNADDKVCSACTSSQGICGSNQLSNEFLCLCRDGPGTRSCHSRSGYHGPNMKLKLGVGLGAAIMAITTCSLIICILISKKVTKSNQDLEDVLRNYGPLSPKRYSFSEVKKMTNSFKDELGKGGYGSVYKGKLPDGHLVAVKLLNTSKGKGQEFINEVASISRTSHVNVVTLLGFCLEGKKRALIYDFMPNGSLEKFIYNGDNSKSSHHHQHLEWEKMYQIVIGIAKGLEYLHRGCNIRILHFDIKPHNILLDHDFCPKISDFGLAKLCLKKESILSMSEARGTIGYIAPEVFSKNFGVVSHKSDVYSYGMMILELVGCKSNLESAADDHSSEAYFPHLIYRHIERDTEFRFPGSVTREENEIAKKMIIVALWCIQARPSDRPPMNKVIEMLLGDTEALQVPPMPFLSSPPELPLDSFTISLP